MKHMKVGFVFLFAFLVLSGNVQAQSLLRVDCTFNDTISFSDGNFVVYEDGQQPAAPAPAFNDGGALSGWPGWASITSQTSAQFEAMSLGALEQFNVVEICGSGPQGGAPQPKFLDNAAVKAKIQAALQAGVSFYSFLICENTDYWPGEVPLQCDNFTSVTDVAPGAENHPIITFPNPDISNADLSANSFSFSSFVDVSAEYQPIALAASNPEKAVGDPVMLASDVFGCGKIFLRTHVYNNPGDEPAMRFIDSVAHYLLDVSCAAQDVAVDPIGRFVIWGGLDAACGKNGLLYLPLTSTGDPAAASPTELLSCSAVVGDVTGIDILREGTSDLYWVVFGGSDPTDDKFLMQINSAGGIIKAPKSIVPDASFGSTKGAASIGPKGNTKFNVWMIGLGGKVYRAVVNKATVTLASIKKTSLVVDSDSSLQVTHKSGAPNFLAAIHPLKVLKGFGVGNNGLPDGTSWRLSTRNDLGSELGGVTDDGLMSICNDFNPNLDQLYDQPLRSTGIPVNSNPEVVTQSVYQALRSADASNLVTNSRRFVIFLLDNGHLYLRKVNNTTGVVMGGTVSLY